MVSIRTDLAGIAARRTLGQASRGIEDRFARLSSGYRITKAQDDAAGMGISRALKAQLNSYHQAVRNTREAMSMLQTMEGGLQETTALLMKIRELAVQFLSGALNTTTRLEIKDEVDGLLGEISRISKNTSYNQTKLLDGSAGDLEFQIGIRGTDSNVIVVPNKRADAQALGIEGLMDLFALPTDNEGNAADRAAHTLVYPNALLGSEMNQPNPGLRNGYGPQKLIFSDIDGTQTEFQIEENHTAVEVANAINGQNGFSAVGENGIEIATAGFNTFSAPAFIKFSDGASTFQVNIAGLDLDGIRGAINANTTLQGAGIYAETGSDGNLSVLSGQGHDIIVDTGGSSAGSMDIRGVFGSAAQSISAGDATTVGGTVRIAMEPGYALDKDNPNTDMLDANMNRIVAGTNNGYPAQTFTREDQTNGTATVLSDPNDTAYEISQKLNQAHSVQTVASNRVTLRSSGFSPIETRNEVRLQQSTFSAFDAGAKLNFNDGVNDHDLDIAGLTLAEIADAINNDTTLASLGITAAAEGTGDIVVTAGPDYSIRVDASASTTGSMTSEGIHSSVTQTTTAGENELVGGAGQAEIRFFDGTSTFSSGDIANKSLVEIRDLINANSTLASNGISAQLSGGNLRILSDVGHDIRFDTTTAVGGSLNVLADFSGDSVTVSANETYVIGGNVEYAPILNQAQFSNYNAWDKGYSKSDPNMDDAAFGSNEVGAQNISLSGPFGDADFSVADGESAASIAAKVNATTNDTGIRATVQTTLTLSNLSHDGTISFNLAADNTVAVPVTATVARTNLQSLVDAVNATSSTTQIFAALGADGSEVVLTHPEGRDIRLSDFEHTSAAFSVDPANAVTVSMRAYGNRETNGDATPFVKLFDGGNGLTDQMNGTVVGGDIKLSAFGDFTATSDIDGGAPGTFAAEKPGSLFNVLANEENRPEIVLDSSILSRLDQAIEQVSDMRTEAGAYFNRITSAYEANESAVMSSTQSHSRIVDVDIAEETAGLSSDQVLRDAGTAVLAQISQSSEAILKLLQ